MWDVELLLAYGLCEMVKSNNLYAVYAACLMLHNSRQPRTHTHIYIHTVDTSYPFRSREATSPLLFTQRCPICMGNNFVWLPRRLLQLTVTSSVNRAQREIYTFFRILIKWHHLSQSVGLPISLLSVACLHIAIFSARDSRDDAYEMRLSLIAAHMQRRVFHTHTHSHTRTHPSWLQ